MELTHRCKDIKCAHTVQVFTSVITVETHTGGWFRITEPTPELWPEQQTPGLFSSPRRWCRPARLAGSDGGTLRCPGYTLSEETQRHNRTRDEVQDTHTLYFLFMHVFKSEMQPELRFFIKLLLILHASQHTSGIGLTTTSLWGQIFWETWFSQRRPDIWCWR